MNDTYCSCFIKSVEPDTWNVLPTVFQFFLSLLISICGVFLNIKFLRKLQLERRNKPPGRKGNIIEPIMRWFCVLQIVFWPYELLNFSQAVRMINLESLFPPLCPFIMWSIALGRTMVGYNSLFVALIRYVYIVHERKANQWDFEVVGRRFQIASISVPITHVIILSLTLRGFLFLPQADQADSCSHLTPLLISFSMNFVSEELSDAIAIICVVGMAFVFLNIVDGYLYIKIFQTIRR